MFIYKIFIRQQVTATTDRRQNIQRTLNYILYFTDTSQLYSLRGGVAKCCKCSSMVLAIKLKVKLQDTRERVPPYNPSQTGWYS